MRKIPFTKYYLLKEDKYSIPLTLTLLDAKRRIIRLRYKAILEWRKGVPHIVAVVSMEDILDSRIPQEQVIKQLLEEEEELAPPPKPPTKPIPKKPKPRRKQKTKKYKLQDKPKEEPVEFMEVPYQLDPIVTQVFAREAKEAMASNRMPLLKHK